MIDAFAILVSCFALAFVILRAIRLNSLLPWFEPLGGRKQPGATKVPDKAARETGIRQGMLSATKNDNAGDKSR